MSPVLVVCRSVGVRTFAAGEGPLPHRPGRKPHQDHPEGSAPDADEAVDKTESGQEP